MAGNGRRLPLAGSQDSDEPTALLERQEKKRKNAGRQQRAITFVLRVLITPAVVCRNGSRLPETHQTSCSRLSQWILWWAFFTALSTPLSPPSLSFQGITFYWRETKSLLLLLLLFVFFFFHTVMMTDCVLHLVRGTLLPFHRRYLFRVKAKTEFRGIEHLAVLAVRRAIHHPP